MALYLASMLGAKPMPRPKRPPAGIAHKHNLANINEEDDEIYPDFDSLLATISSEESRDTLRRIAYLLRARLEMSQFDLAFTLQVGDNFLRKLAKMLIAQGWISQENRKGRHKVYYVMTEAGEKVFAEVRQ